MEKRILKNGFIKLKTGIKFQRTEEEKYMIQMLEEALEEYDENSITSLEEWQEEMRSLYHVNV